MSDQEFAQTETLLRQRLAQLANHAPTTVHIPGEVTVVATARSPRRRRRIGVIAAVTALVGAGGFTTYSFLGASNDGGAATPQEAVTTFVSALEHEDLLGMIDVTLPEEVGVLRAAVDTASSDAKRIGLVSTDFNASGVKGIDISVDDLTLDTNFLEGGLAEVSVTGGRLSASFDPTAFPFGDKLRALLGSPSPGQVEADLGTSDTAQLLMTVERDGRWYVSIEYTVAEYVRRAAHLDEPGPVARTPVGFDSPQQAVDALFARLSGLDLAAALETFAPGEDAMAWLAQSWVDNAQAGIERARANGWSVTLSGLTYETIGDGDHLTLRPLTFKVEGSVPAGFNQNSSASADPSLPTVVTAFDGSGYALLPPGEMPATIDALHFTNTFPASDGGAYNFTSADPNGNITPLEFPAEPTGGPQPFTIERADGCTTYRGSGAEALFSVSSIGEAVDGGYQLCSDAGALGGLSLLMLSSGFENLPSISVVQSGGKWYVSPLGTVLASATTSLHDVVDGASLFDSPLGLFIYGPVSRTSLERVLDGQSVDQINEACLPALTIDNGVVSGVVADPPPAAVRACSETLYNSTSTSTGAAPAPVVAEAPAATTP
ncbi:MAG: hypothetical protein ABI706_13590 [Ilumatobacteraceae bacterium]